MSIKDIRPGLAGTIEATVAEEHAASHVGSGEVRVRATPVGDGAHQRVIINLDKFDTRMGAKILRRIPNVKH